MNEGNYLYEYSVIRYVPAVERDEFINIGLIMMCKKQKWIRMGTFLPQEKIRLFRSELPLESLDNQLSAFTLIVNADAAGGPIAALPVEERFRWLTAAKSSCLQTSRPHPGLTDDLDTTFDQIFREQVL